MYVFMVCQLCFALIKLLKKKINEEKTPPNAFYKIIITLIPTHKKGNGEKYRPVSHMNIDFKNSMHFASLISNLILGGDGEYLEALVFRRSSVWGKIMDVLNIGSRP